MKTEARPLVGGRRKGWDIAGLKGSKVLLSVGEIARLKVLAELLKFLLEVVCVRFCG